MPLGNNAVGGALMLQAITFQYVGSQISTGLAFTRVRARVYIYIYIYIYIYTHTHTHTYSY